MSQITEDKEKLKGRIRELVEEFEAEYPGIIVREVVYKSVSTYSRNDWLYRNYVTIKAEVE